MKTTTLLPLFQLSDSIWPKRRTLTMSSFTLFIEFTKLVSLGDDSVSKIEKDKAQGKKIFYEGIWKVIRYIGINNDIRIVTI